MEQVCLITNEVVTETKEEHMTRPCRPKPKSAREERFTSQSWEALRESGNPVYDISREYVDVFRIRFQLNSLLIVVFGTRSISYQVRSIV